MAAPLLLDAEVARLWVAAADLARTLVRVELVAAGRAEAGWEVHVVPTLIACLAGVIRLERPRRAPLDLRPGEAALIAPGAAHRHAPLRRGSAALGQGFMLGRSDIELIAPARTWWLAIAEEPARARLERACRDAGGRLALVRQAVDGIGTATAQSVAPMSAAVERMWLFLRRERLSPITVADVLRASGLARTRAHQVFRAYFGETPHRLLTGHRLEYARHLLAQGRGVAEVAQTCGFRNRRHLTAAFRATHGLPPRGWMRRFSADARP